MTSASSTPEAATFAAIETPSLTLPDGRVVTAARLLPFREGRAFLRAMEGEGNASARLDAAFGVLVGMGFAEADVEQLPIEEVVQHAVRFFTASCQRTAAML